MRVFEHEEPGDPGTEYVCAVRRGIEIVIKRSALPTGTQDAWDALIQMMDDRETDPEAPPPEEPESHLTLDLDWYDEDDEKINFNDLMDDIDNEIQYITDLLPTIDGMTFAELKTAFKRSEKRDRSILETMKYVARATKFLVKMFVRWGMCEKL